MSKYAMSLFETLRLRIIGRIDEAKSSYYAEDEPDLDSDTAKMIVNAEFENLKKILENKE